MYCNYCGTPNPDDGAFCSKCGKPLNTGTFRPAAPQPPQPQPVMQPRPAAPQPKKMDSDDHFRLSWRRFASSPFVLIVIVLHSLGALLNAISVDETFDTLESLLGLLGNKAEFQGDILKLILIAPGILIAIGLWMMFANAIRRDTSPVNVSGLRMVRVITIISVTLSCIGLVLAFVQFMDTLNEVPDALRGAVLEALFDQLGTVLIVLLAYIITALTVQIKAVSMLDAMCCCAESCYTDTDHVKGVAIGEFILGGANILMLAQLEVEFDSLQLEALIGLAMPFLFGAVLLCYNSFMERLYEEMDDLFELNRPERVTSSVYSSVPTWKRVQEKNAQTQTWMCSCGRSNANYLTSCTCGAKRMDVVLAARSQKSGWECSKCGSHNAQGAICCIHCGAMQE